MNDKLSKNELKSYSSRKHLFQKALISEKEA